MAKDWGRGLPLRVGAGREGAAGTGADSLMGQAGLRGAHVRAAPTHASAPAPAGPALSTPKELLCVQTRSAVPRLWL